MPILIEEKQKKGKSMKDFVERFKNFSLGCPKGMPLSMLLQSCRYNLCVDIETNAGMLHAHTWKELQE